MGDSRAAANRKSLRAHAASAGPALPAAICAAWAVLPCAIRVAGVSPYANLFSQTVWIGTLISLALFFVYLEAGPMRRSRAELRSLAASVLFGSPQNIERFLVVFALHVGALTVAEFAGAILLDKMGVIPAVALLAAGGLGHYSAALLAYQQVERITERIKRAQCGAGSEDTSN